MLSVGGFGSRCRRRRRAIGRGSLLGCGGMTFQQPGRRRDGGGASGETGAGGVPVESRTLDGPGSGR
jgi:hypothetical protein